MRHAPLVTATLPLLAGRASAGVARRPAHPDNPLYHSSGETLETVSVPRMERVARLTADLLKEVTRAPRGRWTPVGD